MSCSILRFIPLSVIDPDEIDNPEYYLKLYPSCIVSFTDSSTGIYLRSTQAGNNIIIQESNTINFTSRIDYVVVRYNNGSGSFTQWKLPGENTLNYYHSNLVENDYLKNVISSNGSITINSTDPHIIDLTTSGGDTEIDISDTNLINKTLTPPKMKNLNGDNCIIINSVDNDLNLSLSGVILNANNSTLIDQSTNRIKTLLDSTDIQIAASPYSFSLNSPNLLTNLPMEIGVSNLIAKNYDTTFSKHLRMLEINNVTELTVDDPKVKFQEATMQLRLNTTHLVGRVSDNKTFSNLQYSTGKLKSLIGDDNIIVINTDNSTLTLTTSGLIEINESNLLIPDTKYLNNLQVAEITKSASDGKIQLTQENGNLTINVGNCLSRYQQDGNLCNMQSGGYCRSLAFGDDEFSLNLSNGSWMRFINKKLLTNNAAVTSGTVSNLICRDSSSVVQKELKNIVGGNNVTLTNNNEEIQINITDMSGEPLLLKKLVCNAQDFDYDETDSYRNFLSIRNSFIYDCFDYTNYTIIASLYDKKTYRITCVKGKTNQLQLNDFGYADNECYDITIDARNLNQANTKLIVRFHNLDFGNIALLHGTIYPKVVDTSISLNSNFNSDKLIFWEIEGVISGRESTTLNIHYNGKDYGGCYF